MESQSRKNYTILSKRHRNDTNLGHKNIFDTKTYKSRSQDMCTCNERWHAPLGARERRTKQTSNQTKQTSKHTKTQTDKQTSEQTRHKKRKTQG